MILEDAALVYAGAGEGPIALRGTSSLAGNTAAGQSLSIESTCSKNVVVSIAANVANDGSIVMTNGDGCGNNATVNVGPGATLTNSGALTSELAHGGSRTITGNLSNAGTLHVAANSSYGGSGATLTNTGTIVVSEGVTLRVSGPANVTNEAGTIDGPGTLMQSGGTFTENAGTTGAGAPVVLEDGKLQYTGKGASTIAVRGSSTLAGFPGSKGAETLPAKGQTLLLQSSCSKNATLSAPAFTNEGTIVLENGDGCGNNVTLSLSGTLTDKGTIKVEHDSGGSRTIEAAIVNEKTLSVAAGQTLTVHGTYTQGKKGTYATGIASSSSFGVLTVTGTASIGGALSIVQAKGLTVSEGQKFAVLGSSALTGTFAKLKGNKVKKSKPPLKFNPSYSGTGVTLTVGP